MVLDMIPSDMGWAPVVFRCWYSARFTWVHPDCLEPCATEDDGVVVIGHTKNRGNRQPSHDVGKKRVGARREYGVLVLDACWRGQTEGSEACNGFCAALVLDTASRPDRMGDILDFVSRRESGLVVCSHGVHLSVSAGQIMELRLRRRVDYDSFAGGIRYCSCGDRIGAAVHRLDQTLRRLPSASDASLLSLALGLAP